MTRRAMIMMVLTAKIIHELVDDIPSGVAIVVPASDDLGNKPSDGGHDGNGVDGQGGHREGVGTTVNAEEG